MDSMNYLFEPVAGDIPDLFKTHNEKKHIDHCIMCDDYLLEDGKNYLIEKAIKKYPDFEVADCIFEYAICFDCAQKMQENVSKESLEQMNNYFESHVNFADRSMNLYKENKFEAGEWLDKCVVKGTEKNDCKEYQVYGHFVGNQMIYSVFPYMISNTAIEELTELLSQSTKDEMDDFINNNFGLPPVYKDLLKDRPLVLV